MFFTYLQFCKIGKNADFFFLHAYPLPRFPTFTFPAYPGREAVGNCFSMFSITLSGQRAWFQRQFDSDLHNSYCNLAKAQAQYWFIKSQNPEGDGVITHYAWHAKIPYVYCRCSFAMLLLRSGVSGCLCFSADIARYNQPSRRCTFVRTSKVSCSPHQRRSLHGETVLIATC